MSPLEAHLRARISQDGPISLADYMTVCLQHPDAGYYMTGNPLGRDFTTAPEISQMFGEMVGLSLAQAWRDQGAAPRIILAELGPGRGTLMADILRATRRMPGFHDALELWLVEASPSLRALQAEQLQDAAPTWSERACDLPGDRPLFLVANEFFDALPIRQFQRAEGDAWCERRVGYQDNRLAIGLAGAAPQPALAHRLADTGTGDIVETCAAASAVMAELGLRIAQNGGAAIILDYGDWRSLGDTFQALRQGQSVDPMEGPGTADLTAHVDFEALAQAAAPACHSRLTPQGVFLERLGITARAQALAKGLSGDALRDHIAAHRRLTHPAEMGNLFKVLGVMPDGAAPPPGLER